MICTAEQAIAEAKRWIGYLEKKDGSNLTSKTANAGSGNYTIFGKVMHSVYPKTMDYPAHWCDCFVDYCIYAACEQDLKDAETVLCGVPDDYTVNSANMYKKAGRWGKTPKKGAQIFFTSNGKDSGICHTGIVTSLDANSVHTIEGNTSAAAGMVPNGGCVRAKSYDRGNSRIAGYGYPRYAEKAGNMKKYLYGVDVSSNQDADVLQRIKYDFAIVKMGGNPHGYRWDYVNPYAKQQVTDALSISGCAGLYWFCYGKLNAHTEADRFVSEVQKLGLVGKVVLVADYEADALKKGAKWLDKFCKRVKAKTDVTPIVYASASVIASQKLDALGYPLWSANYYYDKLIQGYDTSGMRNDCPSAVIWQFTDKGRLSGYNGTLDLNRFTGTKAEWMALAKATAQKPATTQKKPVYAKYRVNAKAGLNCRKKAGTGNPITRTLSYGTTVNVSEIVNGWAHTKKGDWCCAKYLTKK